MKGGLFRTKILLIGISFLILTACKPDPLSPEVFPAGRVFSLHIDPIGVVWAGSDAGPNILSDSQWLCEDEFGDFIRNPVISMGAASNGWIFDGSR